MSDPITLPPGWLAHWDAHNNRTVYTEQATGRSFLSPPEPNGTMDSHAASAIPTGPHNRNSLAPSEIAQQETHHDDLASIASPHRSGQSRGKRIYATNQSQAYSGDPATGPNQFVQSHTASQSMSTSFFSPAHHPPPNEATQVPPQFASHPDQNHGADVGTVTQQFQNLAFGQKQYMPQSVNLVGMRMEPSELEAAPPVAKLPPGTCISNSTFARPDPSYQRCTLNAVPNNESLLKKIRLPLALVITPYRSLQPGDPDVPVITDTVIARCRRCRTYINPYVTFIEGGNRWKCCMCNLSNETPQLFDWDQHRNQPADRWQRAELNHAVVEFVAPTEYMVRPPQPPTYIFLLDVSYPAIGSGMVATAARTLLETLDRLPNDDNRCRVCVICVDTSLHFFSLNANSPEPAMLVVSDLDDIFLPKPDDLLVNLAEIRPAVESLLTRLHDMFKNTHVVGNAMGAALQAAYKLISPSGGKIMVLSASLPTLGPGALKPREDVKILGTSKESSLLQAATAFYKTFAVDCSRCQVSVDMWLFSSTYTDVATLSCLPRYTGGSTFFYPSFNAARSEDASKFAHEFGRILASPICLEAVMRVRASRGIRLSAFHGNFFVRSTDLLALPAVPEDQSYVIELQIEDPLSGPVAVFQTAVLHTTSSGERRIRVITLALPTTSSISEAFASADQVAIATVLANKAVERSMQSKLEDARDAVTNKLIDILGTYKTTMTAATTGASPQLLICDNLKLLPMLALGLLKHVGLRQSSQIPSDMRAYAQALLTTLPSQLLVAYMYPVLYSLHNMPKECGTVGENGVILPPKLNASSERFERHGLFLIEDGQNIFLWVGRDAVPQLIIDVFDLPASSELRGGKMTLSLLNNPFSQRVNAIIGKVREQRRGPYYPHLYIVKEDGEPSLRMWALSCLVEDRMDSLPSYQQYISSLKDKVNSSSF